MRVTAAGVNFVDALLVQGLYQIKPPLPFVAGGESVGVVTEVGEGVTRPRVGDRVLVTSGVGGFATEIVAPADRVLLVPPSLTDGQAATFMQSYMTAYLRAWCSGHACSPASGCWCSAPEAASGWPRSTSVEPLGLQVIAAASSADKRAMAASRGAVAVIDSTTEDVKARAREISGDGVDAVYDPVGGVLGEAVPARATRRRTVPRDRVRVRRHPEAAREPGAAAQSSRHRRRLGRLGRPESGREPRSSPITCSP